MRGYHHLEPLMKAVSWRILATLCTIIISYFVVGEIKYALAIGSLEVIFKIALYYFHERLWVLISHGLRSFFNIQSA